MPESYDDDSADWLVGDDQSVFEFPDDTVNLSKFTRLDLRTRSRSILGK